MWLGGQHNKQGVQVGQAWPNASKLQKPCTQRNKIIDEPYVLTSQVSQVFYVNDDKDPDWACVVKTKPKNVYDVGQGQRADDNQPCYHKREPL